MKRLLKRKPLAEPRYVENDVPQTTAPPLNVHWTRPDTWYIAVHRGGFGVALDAATAIRTAQESVLAKEKPSQLAIYASPEPMEPTGFVTWPNGHAPRLVALTNTHAAWKRR
jgi:hypothetical protein